MSEVFGRGCRPPQGLHLLAAVLAFNAVDLTALLVSTALLTAMFTSRRRPLIDGDATEDECAP